MQQPGKIKITLLDRILNREKIEKWKEIVILREQVLTLVKTFDALDIVVKLQKYREIHTQLFKYSMFSLDEKRMIGDLGEDAVIERLKGDRDRIIELIKDVKDIDITDIQKQIRERKLEILGI